MLCLTNILSIFALFTRLLSLLSLTQTEDLLGPLPVFTQLTLFFLMFFATPPEVLTETFRSLL